MDGPNPTSSKRMPERMSVRRKVFCTHYDSCLNCAVEKGWEGFACDDCNAYSLPDWSKGRWIEDAYRCMALALAIDSPDLY